MDTLTFADSLTAIPAQPPDTDQANERPFSPSGRRKSSAVGTGVVTPTSILKSPAEQGLGFSGYLGRQSAAARTTPRPHPLVVFRSHSIAEPGSPPGPSTPRQVSLRSGVLTTDDVLASSRANSSYAAPSDAAEEQNDRFLSYHPLPQVPATDFNMTLESRVLPSELAGSRLAGSSTSDSDPSPGRAARSPSRASFSRSSSLQLHRMYGTAPSGSDSTLSSPLGGLGRRVSSTNVAQGWAARTQRQQQQQAQARGLNIGSSDSAVSQGLVTSSPGARASSAGVVYNSSAVNALYKQALQATTQVPQGGGAVAARWVSLRNARQQSTAADAAAPLQPRKPSISPPPVSSGRFLSGVLSSPPPPADAATSAGDAAAPAYPPSRHISARAITPTASAGPVANVSFAPQTAEPPSRPASKGRHSAVRVHSPVESGAHAHFPRLNSGSTTTATSGSGGGDRDASELPQPLDINDSTRTGSIVAPTLATNPPAKTTHRLVGAVPSGWHSVARKALQSPDAAPPLTDATTPSESDQSTPALLRFQRSWVDRDDDTREADAPVRRPSQRWRNAATTQSFNASFHPPTLQWLYGGNSGRSFSSACFTRDEDVDSSYNPEGSTNPST